MIATEKHQSLFEYATKELGYADDAAFRRINALRLLREMPQLGSKIESGVLTLSTFTVASNALRAEAKHIGQPRSQTQKHELISALENKSRREAEEVVSQIMQIPKAALRAAHLMKKAGPQLAREAGQRREQWNLGRPFLIC